MLQEQKAETSRGDYNSRLCSYILLGRSLRFGVAGQDHGGHEDPSRACTQGVDAATPPGDLSAAST